MIDSISNLVLKANKLKYSCLLSKYSCGSDLCLFDANTFPPLGGSPGFGDLGLGSGGTHFHLFSKLVVYYLVILSD